jgi:hypothetical protein
MLRFNPIWRDFCSPSHEIVMRIHLLNLFFFSLLLLEQVKEKKSHIQTPKPPFLDFSPLRSSTVRMLCILAAIGAFGVYTPVFFLVSSTRLDDFLDLTQRLLASSLCSPFTDSTTATTCRIWCCCRLSSDSRWPWASWRAARRSTKPAKYSTVGRFGYRGSTCAKAVLS